MTATLAIGDLRFEVTAEGERTPRLLSWSVEIGSKRKVQEKVADKDDDATATDQGREVRPVKITFTWPNTFQGNALADPILEKLDPSNPKPGDPPAFAYWMNGLDIAKRKNVRAILIKEADGPNPDDAGKMTYKLTCSSWTKPRPSPGAGTKKGTQKFVEAGQTQTVTGFGGNNNTVTFPKPVAPKP